VSPTGSTRILGRAWPAGGRSACAAFTGVTPPMPAAATNVVQPSRNCLRSTVLFITSAPGLFPLAGMTSSFPCSLRRHRQPRPHFMVGRQVFECGLGDVHHDATDHAGERERRFVLIR